MSRRPAPASADATGDGSARSRRPTVRLLKLLALCLLTLAACYRGGAPSNGLLHVVNLGDADVSIHLQAPGPFGQSTTQQVTTCQDYAWGFPPGDEQVVITTPSDSLTFTLSAPESGQTVASYVIDANGKIRATTDDQLPASPFCIGTPGSS